MAVLDRNRLMFFAGFLTSVSGTAPADVGWEVIGSSNDDLSKELNPDVETGKNVLGEAFVKMNGYEPTVNVDPYEVDDSSPMYEKLKAAAIQEKFGEDDIGGYFTEAVFDTATETSLTGTGYMRKARIIPQSTGGDTSSFKIPIEIRPYGPQTKVNVSYTKATHAVTITAASGD